MVGAANGESPSVRLLAHIQPSRTSGLPDAGNRALLLRSRFAGRAARIKWGARKLGAVLPGLCLVALFVNEASRGTNLGFLSVLSQVLVID